MFGCLCRVYLLFGFEAFDLVMFMFLLVTTLRVHPAVTRLTVYRRLGVACRDGSVSSKWLVETVIVTGK